MRLYITGATGFVGSHVVAEALRRGHDVTAVVRPASRTEPEVPVEATGDLRSARVDLRSPDGLASSLADVDSVIHLAAAKSGDFHTQFAGTVVATENLLQAMHETSVTQLVAISTFSVYDYMGLKPGAVLDEELCRVVKGASGCVQERRSAALVSRIDVGAFADEKLDD